VKILSSACEKCLGLGIGLAAG